MSLFDIKGWMRKEPAESREKDDRKFVYVGRMSDIPVGSGKVVVVMGRDVGLYNCAGTIKAIENLCPHNNRPIGTEEFDDQHVTCLWHGLRFAFDSGVCPEAEHYRVETYSVRMNGEEIWVSALPDDPVEERKTRVSRSH